MKNNKLFVIFASMIFALLLPFVFGSNVGKAFASEQDFVLLEDYQDFVQAFSQADAFEKNYKLMSNVDFSQVAGFVPLGFNPDTNTVKKFSGIFDGNGFSISGLNFDSTKTFYTYGLFAYLENAKITNLIIENIAIENENSFNHTTLNNQTILVGGVAAISESSVIENVSVSFSQFLEPLKLSGNRVDFGGVVARALYGTVIKNVKVSASLEFDVETEKLQNLNVGLIAADVYNSKIQNVVASGEIFVAKAQNVAVQNTMHNLGAIAGQVERAGTIVKATYSDIVFNTQTLNANKVNIGALIGLVKEFEAPAQTNISYNVMVAKKMVDGNEQNIEQVFGNAASYNTANSVYHFLPSQSFSAITQPQYWQGLLESYQWNTKFVWKLSSNSLPVLQMFEEYEIALSIEKTRIALSSSILPQDLIVINFEDEASQEIKNTKKDFRYNQEVKVLIALINEFDIYYALESVEINGITVVDKFGTFGPYTLEEVEISNNEDDVEIALYDGLESKKMYLFGFNANNFDSGEISVTLEKVGFDFTVETQNAEEGRVRRREAQNPTASVVQTLYVGSVYEFVAVPTNNNFALEKWVMELVDEVTLEPYYVELEDYGKFSNITFEFGKNDSTKITENFLSGGKLVAVFTSNITKITFMVEVGSQENKNAGQILNGEETEEFASSQQTSFIKGRELTFVAKEKQGYKFVGWFDSENRNRGTNQVLVYETIQGEDEIALIAVFERDQASSSLTTLWIVLGSVLGAGAVVGIVIFIKKKRSDFSYRNFY